MTAGRSPNVEQMHGRKPGRDSQLAAADGTEGSLRWSEVDRLQALDRYGILDTGREPGFDDIADLAADILNAPIAVVNFIAADRQWFKAEKGIGQDSLPLDVSICRHAILQPRVLVVPDLTKDPRFDGNPFVHVDGGLRFYAGALLETPDGLPLGTVCVLDTQAREQGITERQSHALKALAAQTMSQLELRRSHAAARSKNEHLSAMFAQAAVGISEVSLDGRFLVVNDRLCERLGRTRAELLSLGFADVTHPDDVAANLPKFERLAETGEGFNLDKRYVRPDGSVVWANSSVTGLLDEAGRLRATMAVTADITARKEEERSRLFLLELGDALQDLTDAKKIQAEACRRIGEHLHVAQVGFAEVAADHEHATVHADWTDGRIPSVVGTWRMDDFGPTFIAAIKAGETAAIADVRLDPRTCASDVLAAYESIATRAILDVPLVRAGRMNALLFLHHPEPRAWSEADIALAEEVVARLNSDVERARAEGARDRAAAMSAAQNRVLELAMSDATLDQTLAAIAATVENLSASDALASILLLDDTGTHLRHGAAPSLPAAYNEAIDGIVIGPAVGSCGTAIHRNAPVFVSDIASDPLWSDFCELAMEHGLRACWSIPIRSARGALLGTFAIYHRQPREPTENDMEIIDFVARTAGLVVERASAEEAMRQSEARLRFLAELEDRLFNSADAFGAMSGATEMLGMKLEASRCAYADVDPDGDRFWIRSDYNAPGLESSVGEYRLDLFGPRAAAELRAGATLVVADVEAELAPGEGREMFQAIAIDAIVCCPLIKEGRLAAMMAVHQDRARVWTSGEVALVKEAVERCWAHVERVGAEARLRDSEERLRLAINNADVGFWDVDEINNRLTWPPRTKAMFGIAAETPVTMQDFYDGLHPDDAEATAAAYAAAADPKRRALYDVEYRTVSRADGAVRWVAAKGRGVFDPSGRCLRVAGTAVEITARRAAEEALRELNATLEARIATAIGEREEAQAALRQSQKMEAMGQLTGGVAHDFNNLLTPIVGSLDLLQRKGFGGEREQRLIAGAVQSADRARTLVQRLLAFARRQPLQPIPVDVSALVAGMGDLVSSTTGPQIKVVVEAPDGLPPAKADPNQLEMAILNLAVNARDAMPDGGTLRISAGRESILTGHRSNLRPGHYLRVSVADTGHGMDEATLAHAIEPFFSTKGIGKGTGLGLSMVHGLASQLGGALTIQSSVGLGTNIELWFPQSVIAVEETEPPEVRSAPRASGRALLVDDEELVRLSTADMLGDLGYAVIEAASGEEALSLFAGGAQFDLVVTDHLMPGMTGTELALAVRAAQPGMPVLLVSGYAESDGIDPGLPRLTKPFRKDELAASIGQMSQ